MVSNGKKVVATIEARMTSTRLPGKVLLPMAGKPVLEHVVERHRRSRLTDEVVVATTTNAADDAIEELCKRIGCSVFRGSEEDVLGRIVAAGKEHGADILVQGMSDDPLIDWRFVDQLVELLEEGGYDCTDSELDKTFPIGIGMRVYAFPVLVKAAEVDTERALREHAGYSIRSQREKFKVGSIQATATLVWPDLRVTLDTKEDYDMIRSVYEALYPTNPDFSTLDVVTFLRTRPDIVLINKNIVQRPPDHDSKGI
ncbi:glycosyltransferase family protein [Candidatus Kaiserbacteria bacterium]|nr:glycosyltransferase family protein [Candidatus Kaiserbacteria bacterium]